MTARIRGCALSIISPSDFARPGKPLNGSALKRERAKASGQNIFDPRLSRGCHARGLMPCHLGAEANNLILDAQFAPLEFGNGRIASGRTPEFMAEFLFQLSVLLLERFKMRLYRHRQLLCERAAPATVTSTTG
tara:strand:- start:100 stop:501 length:402 start_codon:yes stop_codon:yes gene_type:complete